MKADLGFSVRAKTLFETIKRSPIMEKKGYHLVYQVKYTKAQHNHEGYGICYVDSTGCKTYIHIRIYGYGRVSSFAWAITLDVTKATHQDINDLVQEIKQGLQGPTS